MEYITNHMTTLTPLQQLFHLFIYLLIHNAWNLKVMAFTTTISICQQPDDGLYIHVP
jgi:hypothetical protein